MKKFLLVLLVAVALSSNVKEEDTELSATDWIDDLPGYIKKVVDWLKDKGLWDELMNLIEKYGAPKAIDFCKDKIPSPLDSLCKTAIDKIMELIK